MTDIHIIPASYYHADIVGQNLRDDDCAELFAGGDTQPVRVLKESITVSRWSNCVLIDGVPAILYGVAPKSARVGLPWMLATDDIYKIRREFVRECRAEVDAMQAAFPMLMNAVHKNNRLAIRWLEWLGFSLSSKPLTGAPEFMMFWRSENV